MGTREERAAKNEATAREINEQIEAAHEGAPPSRLPMVCECGYEWCEQVIDLTPEEYTDLRGDGRRFAVVADHVISGLERIVSESSRFVVVAKREGVPSDVATDRDPRD